MTDLVTTTLHILLGAILKIFNNLHDYLDH